ncbi:MAG TPA: hypothetical protein VJ731_17040, partial [Terriglobales bacterium]|nr:hypothetical protein [Terriglobales bacterium]
MITLIVFAFVGAVLFLSLLLIAHKNRPTVTNDGAALVAVGEILKLESLSLRNAETILDSSDYRALRSNPALAEVAKRLRRERRDLALLWFCMLLEDLKKLHRFRGLLVRSGLSLRFYEEVQVA